jgi:hypothetical protein
MPGLFGDTATSMIVSMGGDPRFAYILCLDTLFIHILLNRLTRFFFVSCHAMGFRYSESF